MTATYRKDWDTYFMDIACMVSTRSRCNRRHVGAVLVQGKSCLVPPITGRQWAYQIARRQAVCSRNNMRWRSWMA